MMFLKQPFLFKTQNFCKKQKLENEKRILLFKRIITFLLQFDVI